MKHGVESRPRQEEISRHVASALGWRFVDLESYDVSCGMLRRISRELACRLRCVPLAASSDRIVLAVDDPFAGAYVAANASLLGPPYRRGVELVMTTPRGLDAALRRRLTLVRG